MLEKVFYVNGKQVNEPYKWHRDNMIYPSLPGGSAKYQRRWESVEFVRTINIRDTFGLVVVPKNHVFAMDENRDNSLDSRFWASLHKRFLKGKPLFISFSFDPGHEASNNFDILRFWQWKSIRLGRVG